MDAVWLHGKQIAFSGQLVTMRRLEAVNLVRSHGGEVVTRVSNQTSCLVLGVNPLGKDGKPSLILRKARRLQKEGYQIEVLTEEQFFERCGVGDSDQLYSESHVCKILKIPHERLSRWLRSGLVQPHKMERKIAFLDFAQVSWAKTLCKLTGAGITTATIRRSLHQMRKWLDPEDVLAQLTILEQDGRVLVRLANGQLAEPHGQPHLNFHDDECEHPVSCIERNAHDWADLGISLAEDGNHKEAVDAYRKALRLGGPDATTCFNLANAFYHLGHKERAVERFLQAIEIDAAFAEAWNNLGNLQFELGQSDQALDSLRQAVACAPKNPDFYYNLADTLDRLGLVEEARIAWRKCLHCGETGVWAEHAQKRLLAAGQR